MEHIERRESCWTEPSPVQSSSFGKNGELVMVLEGGEDLHNQNILHHWIDTT